MADIIQIRRDTAALWNTTNPILATGEFGYENDTGKIKIGDGTTTWTSLQYTTFGSSSPIFSGTVTAPTLNASTTLQIGGTTITSTAAELNYVDGVTSAIQTQINAKVASLSDLSITSTAAELNKLDGVTATTAELNYVDGVTSNIQTQLNAAGTVSNVVEDTTPQLGGNLDVQSSEITTSTSNGNIKVIPNGSGVFEVKGAGGSDGTLQLNCSANSHGVKIKSPPHSAGASYTLTLPNNDGDADQILQTNGSGVLTWGDAAASGGSIDLVASGALTNGSVVQMNTDGTISTPVLSQVSSPVVNGEHLANTGSGAHCCCYDDVNNQIFVFYYQSSQWYCAVATPSATNELVFVTTTMTGITSYDSPTCSAVYVPSANKVIFAHHNTNYGLEMHVVTANAADGVSIGAADTVNISFANTFMTLGYDPSSGKAIIYYSKYSQGYVYAKLLSISATTITGGNEVQVTDWNPDYGVAVYDTASGKHVFISSRTTNGDVDAAVITVSGTSITVGSTVVIMTASDKADAVYNTNLGKTIVVYGNNSTGYIDGRVLSISGTTPSVSSATQLNTQSTSHIPIIHYDSLTYKMYVRISDDIYEISASASSVSAASGSALYDVISYSTGMMAQNQDIYAGYIGLHFWNHAGGQSYSATLTSSTLNADAVLGVVTSAYTNGQTATVSTISSTATISGVVAGSKYYSQKNGTIGTFKTASYSGLGVGTNTLLVKG